MSNEKELPSKTAAEWIAFHRRDRQRELLILGILCLVVATAIAAVIR